MIEFNELNNTYAKEYRENGIGVPLYLTKKGTFEEQLKSNCIDIETAFAIAKEKNYFHSIESGISVPEKVFEQISREELITWYNSLKD